MAINQLMISALLFAGNAWATYPPRYYNNNPPQNYNNPSCASNGGCGALKPHITPGATCVVSPYSNDYLALFADFCACSQETVIASIRYTDTNGAVKTAGPVKSAYLSGASGVLTQAYNVPNTAIKSGSPVTVTYYHKQGYTNEPITTYSYTHVPKLTVTGVKATTTVTPVTMTSYATASSTTVSTRTVNVPQVTTSKPCTVGTVTNTADAQTETSTLFTKPPAVTTTKTVGSTKTDTVLDTKTKTLRQHTVKQPCTYGTLTKTVHPYKSTVTSTVNPVASTKTTYVQTTETETRWSTHTVVKYGSTHYEQCTKGTTTKYAPTSTKGKDCTITPYPSAATKTSIKHVTTQLACIPNKAKLARGQEDGLEKRSNYPYAYGGYDEPDCNPQMTTYTTGTTTIVTSDSTTKTTTAVVTSTDTTSVFSNPPTTTTCANAYATTTSTPTTTATVFKPSSVTETNTETSTSIEFATITKTTLSVQTPSPATTTVCKDVQATATYTPSVTVTRYAHGPRETHVVTATRTRTRTVLQHTTTVVQEAPATSCHWTQATTTVTPVVTAGKCSTLDQATHTVTTVIKVTDTVYQDKYPTPCASHYRKRVEAKATPAA